MRKEIECKKEDLRGVPYIEFLTTKRLSINYKNHQYE